MIIWKILLDAIAEIIAENRARKCANLNMAINIFSGELAKIKDRITEIEKEIEEATPKTSQKPTEREIERLEELNLMRNYLALEAAQITYLMNKAENRRNKIENSFFFRRTA